MAGKSRFIQHKFHFSLSFFCVEIIERLSMNIYCDPAMFASGTVLSAENAKMTET